MRLNEIHIRDPFILPVDGVYYLYGSRGWETWLDHASGLDVYTSRDLENWSGPTQVFTPPAGFWADRNFWAPEVHAYRGAYYMLASFKSASACRGTQILRAATPLGPFLPHSDGPVTPRDWECLDGTLHVDRDGKPWMVFCHEWVQVGDGEICALPLAEDLSAASGEPRLLFRASEPEWSDGKTGAFTTDGPFLYASSSGRLLMLWSGFSQRRYVQALAVSESGRVQGPWRQAGLLYQADGGHGMVFRTFSGALKMILHTPNPTPQERPLILALEEKDGMLHAVKEETA